MQSLDEVIDTLQAGIGLSDTMLGLRVEDVEFSLSALRIVVVRRPLPAVRASMARIGYPMAGGFLDTLSEALDDAAKIPHAMSIEFEDLPKRDTCAAIFRHCLGIPLPDEWWDLWRDVRVETSAQSMIEAAQRNHAGVRAIYGV